jgi:hypothetical protein
MSVIGRLDEQVDALLIQPLKKRGAHNADEEGAQAATETQGEAAPVADGKSRATAPGKPREREGAQHGELPVWLL